MLEVAKDTLFSALLSELQAKYGRTVSIIYEVQEPKQNKIEKTQTQINRYLILFGGYRNRTKKEIQLRSILSQHGRL